MKGNDATFRKTANLAIIAFVVVTSWLNLRTVVRRDPSWAPDELPGLTVRLEGALHEARREGASQPRPAIGLSPRVTPSEAIPVAPTPLLPVPSLVRTVTGRVTEGDDRPRDLVVAVTGHVEVGSDLPVPLVAAVSAAVEPSSSEDGERALLSATPGGVFDGDGNESIPVPPPAVVETPPLVPSAVAAAPGEPPSPAASGASRSLAASGASRSLAASGASRSLAASGASPSPVALKEVLFSCRAEEWVFHCSFGGEVVWTSEWQAAHRVLTVEFEPVDESCRAEMFPPLQWVARIHRELTGRRCRLQFELRPGVTPVNRLWNGSGRGARVDLPFAGKAAVSTVAEARRGEAELRSLAEEPLHDGVVVRRHRWISRKGAGSDVHVAELDLSRRSFDLQLALAKGTILGRGTCSAMGRSAGALVAVNASFFAGNGEPLGLVAEGDRLLSVPILRRACFGIFDGNRVLMGNPTFSGRLQTPQGTFFIDGVNQRRHGGKLVVYTPDFGRTTGSKTDGLEISVTDGRIVSIQSCNSVIPPRGYVVATEGRWPKKMESLAFWDAVELDIGLTPPWDRGSFAIGGGPRLVREGHISVEWRQEEFTRAFATALAPRSAVGVRADGRVLLVTVDGRRPPSNTGVSLDEMAEILVRLGCVDGLNLDGGGSTTFWADGKVRNEPSDGMERAVSSALVVVPRRVFAADQSGVVSAVKAM